METSFKMARELGEHFLGQRRLRSISPNNLHVTSESKHAHSDPSSSFSRWVRRGRYVDLPPFTVWYERMPQSDKAVLRQADWSIR